MKNLLKIILTASILLVIFSTVLPSYVQAATIPCGLDDSGQQKMCTVSVTSSCDQVGGLGGVVCKVHGLLNSVIPVLVALGMVYFVWGIVSYVMGSDEEAKKTGKDRIVFGIIGLAIIIGVWGLVAIVNQTFGTDNSTAPTSDQLHNLLPR